MSLAMTRKHHGRGSATLYRDCQPFAITRSCSSQTQQNSTDHRRRRRRLQTPAQQELLSTCIHRVRTNLNQTVCLDERGHLCQCHQRHEDWLGCFGFPKQYSESGIDDGSSSRHGSLYCRMNGYSDLAEMGPEKESPPSWTVRSCASFVCMGFESTLSTSTRISKS